MKRLIILVAFMPLLANATLLGRVNAYYSQQTSEAVQTAQDAHDKALASLKAATEAKDASKIATTKADVLNTLMDLELAKKSVPSGLVSSVNDTTGVSQGVGPVTVTSSAGSGTSVDFNAYRLNLLMPWKAKCEKGNKNKLNIMDMTSAGEDCTDTGISAKRFIPVYFFLHKSLNTQITKDTVSSDLLDNEHGGLVNIKFTPSLVNFLGTDSDGKETPYGAKGILDFGVKYVEAPSADPKSVNNIGAGYFGIGVNFEFAMYDPQTTSIKANDKPEGSMGVGIGVYRNWVNSGGFDNSTFSSSVPKNYGTMVLGYEFQITNVVSILGTRSIPTARNSLGTYSSVSVRYTVPSSK